MRTARVERKTKETNICLELNLDGAGIFEGTTGIGFFDHMLDGFARHGFFDLRLEMEGDLQVDGHHTIEDLGIVLGTALKEALKDRRGSADTEAGSFRWMRRWCWLRWICAVGRIFPFRRNFPEKKSETWRQRWCVSFSTRCPIPAA